METYHSWFWLIYPHHRLKVKISVIHKDWCFKRVREPAIASVVWIVKNPEVIENLVPFLSDLVVYRTINTNLQRSHDFCFCLYLHHFTVLRLCTFLNVVFLVDLVWPLIAISFVKQIIKFFKAGVKSSITSEHFMFGNRIAWMYCLVEKGLLFLRPFRGYIWNILCWWHSHFKERTKIIFLLVVLIDNFVHVSVVEQISFHQHFFNQIPKNVQRRALEPREGTLK